MTIKIDMKEAFNRLNWQFIQKCFIDLAFSERWINCMIECIMALSLSIVVNDIPGEHFKPERDIRAGDPISPYIFVTCVLIDIFISR